MTTNSNQNFLARIARAMIFSCDGFAAAIRGEAAFRQELMLSAILIPLAFWAESDGANRAILVGSVVLILIAELANTAIESAVDLHGEEKSILAKKAKDVGSAMVLLAFINAGLMWGIVLLN